MGIVSRFLKAAGGLPLRADDALYAAGFLPVPVRGHGPAHADGNVLRYDETRPTWEAEVWTLVCSRLLRRAGFPDTHAYRVSLARAFGVELAPPRHASARA